MITEKSCGAIVFTRDNDDLRYVIVQSKAGFYGFPKGHVEDKESEQETALREVWEETGLEITLIPGFREEDRYTYCSDQKTTEKQIVYFLGECPKSVLIPQMEELISAQLMDYDSARAAFQFENLKRILAQAHDFISCHFPAEN